MLLWAVKIESLLLHCVDVGDVDEVTNVHAASILRVKYVHWQAVQTVISIHLNP
jgi:hypothetical protein